MDDNAGAPPLTRRQMRLAEQARAQALADVGPGEDREVADAPPDVRSAEEAPATEAARPVQAAPPAKEVPPAEEARPVQAAPPTEAAPPVQAAPPTEAAPPTGAGSVDDPAPAAGEAPADEQDEASGESPPLVPPAVVDDPEEDDVRWEGPLPPVAVVRAAPHVSGPGRPRQGEVRPPSGSLTPAWVPSSAGSAGQHPQGSSPRAPVRAEPPGTPGSEPDGPAAPGRAPGPASAEPHEAVTAGQDGPVPSDPGEARAPLPTLDDLLARRSAPVDGPAQVGWRRTVRVLTGGLVRPRPGRAEQELRDAVTSVQRDFGGPRTVVVINPKGGAHKTTATLLMAATFGLHRGGYVLAWDNNETRGTMGWRTQHGRHHSTAVDLLAGLHRFEDPRQSRVGDLDAYVRSQTAQFDVLASDEDAASAASIDAYAFRSLHRTLSRFYRVMVVDTGNNMRASNWQAAVEAADQVVIVTTVREDTAQSAAWAADALRATGHEEAVRNAVTVLADPAVQRDPTLATRLHDHFSRLTRTVVDVPWDPALVSGGPLEVTALHRRTREAWLRVTAAVAEGL